MKIAPAPRFYPPFDPTTNTHIKDVKKSHMNLSCDHVKTNPQAKAVVLTNKNLVILAFEKIPLRPYKLNN